ncbi:hypothetical protein FE781_02935 [Paenibacillus thermoaerophilus]|nr:hypothetical protein FE781_02935 [Paenibacillus thermoaerophilus]
MSYLCPVCNGLQCIEAACSRCGTTLTDSGRVGDYEGPYSPYRPIDELKLTNGFHDFALHECIHYVCCPACGRCSTMRVREWQNRP